MKEKSLQPFGAYKSLGLLMISALVLSACIAPQVPPPTPLPPAYTEEQLDPFVLQIEAGRWSVLADRALEGVNLVTGRAKPAPIPLSEDALARLDINASINQSLLSLITLVSASCEAGIASAEQCAAFALPDWFAAPQSDTPPDLFTLRQRSDWIGEQTFAFTDAPCALGREISEDYLFCSVE